MKHRSTLAAMAGALLLPGRGLRAQAPCNARIGIVEKDAVLDSPVMRIYFAGLRLRGYREGGDLGGGHLPRRSPQARVAPDERVSFAAGTGGNRS